VFCEFFAAACLMPLAIACAPFAQAQDNSSSADQLSLVDQACIQVMGLRRGETYFARCHESLSQALASRGTGLALAATADQAHPLAIAYGGNSGTEAGKSFYDVAPTVRWNRERYACAQLGFLPGATSFGQCVSALDGAFLPDQN
jgi:hypothetical protein